MSLIAVDGRGRKTDNTGSLALEAQKSILAAAIGRDTGLFYVPELLGYDAKQGVLETEWIDGLDSLICLALQRDPKMGELCYRAGLALAAIHKDLRLPENMKIRLSGEIPANPGGEVFLHGDFNGSNVCFDRRNDRLVIVDWSSAPLMGGKPTFGSRWFDLVWFGHFFFCSRPVRWVGRWRAEVWYQSLIRGYVAASCSSISEREFNDFQGKVEPVLSAARTEMLASSHGLKRFFHSLRLAYAAFLWHGVGQCILKDSEQGLHHGVQPVSPAGSSSGGPQ